MKKLALFILCLATTLCLSAQSHDIHSPSQIMQIMTDSPVSYTLKSGNFRDTDFSDKVLPTPFSASNRTPPTTSRSM